MKYLIFPLFLFLSTSATAQKTGDFDQECALQIQKCRTLSDSIAILTSHRLFHRKDTSTIIQFFEKALKESRPLWFEMEVSLLRQRDDLSRSVLEKMSTKQLPQELHRYVENQIEYLDIITGGEQTRRKYGKVFQSKTDELLQKYLDVKKDIAQGKTDSLIFIASELLKNIPRDKYPMIQVNTLTIALNNSIEKLPDSSLHIINTAIELSESIPETYYRTSLYNVKSIKMDKQQNHQGAIEAAEKFLEMAIISKDTSRIVNAHIGLSMYHQEAGQHEEAYKKIDAAKQIAEQKKDTLAIIRCKSAVAFAKMNEDKEHEAIAILKESIKYADKMDKYNAGLLYLNLIDCYAEVDRQDSAYLYFKELEKFDPNNSTGFIDYAKSMVVHHLIAEGKFTLAQEYINVTLADAEAYNDNTSKSLGLLSQSILHEAKGDYKKALTNYKKHKEVEKLMTTNEKISEITSVKLKGEFEKEKEIIALQNEQETALLKEKQLRTAIGGGLAGLALLLSLLFYRSLRKKTTEIESQKSELETLNNTKDTLFQIIGHDLKKPTIGFRNVSKNINYLVEKGDFDRLKKLGEEVDQDAKSLYNLTDNLLAWALVQKDAVNLKPTVVNASEIANANLELFANLAKQKNITLHNDIDGQCQVNVDRNALDTVIRNLIDNAIKFTHNGGKVTLRSKETDGMQRIYIEDTGIGMSNEAVERIMNKSQNASSDGTNGEKGSGLGLQLVKDLVNKSQGQFLINNKSGKGLVISLDLPQAV